MEVVEEPCGEVVGNEALQIGMKRGKGRLSNIELLRILAIVMIVMMHGAGSLLGTTYLPNRIGLTAINSVGNMGVTTFMLISGYFGIHFRWSRLWSIWAMALFYSLVVFAVDVFSDSFSWLSLYHAITPVTSRRWWFLTCYVVIFCLAPFLNRAVTGLSKRQMEALLGVLLFFFVVSPTFLRNTLTNDMEGKGLPNLILAYLAGQYLAHYELPAVLLRHCGKLFVASVLLTFTASFAVGTVSPRATILFCKDNNVLMVAGAVFLFCWFRQHTFHSAVVNELAGFVFPLYLVNYSVLHYFRQSLIDRTDQLDFWSVYLMVLVTTVLVALVVELVRRLTLSRVVDYVDRRISVYDR